MLRILTVGTDGASSPRGARGRRGLPAGLRRGRPSPELGGRLRRRRPGRARGARRPRALRRDRRDADSTTTATGAARGPAARLRGADRARARARQAAGDPLPRRRRRTRSPCCATARAGVSGRHALLLDARPPRRLRRAADSGSRSRATSPTPAPPTSPRPPRWCRRSGCWSRPTRPTWRRVPERGHPNQPRLRRAHARPSSPACAESSRAELAARGSSATRRACSAGHERSAQAPVSPACAGWREFGVRPDRDLGQNFLVDSNILGVIGRAAELAARRRGARDRRRPRRAVRVPGRAGRARARGRDRPPPGAAAQRRHRPARQRHRSTRRRHGLDLPRSPRADKLVANLPYGIAAGACCGRSRSWRRVRAGSRWSRARSASGSRRAPGSRTYGMPSVLAQLACEVARPARRSPAPSSSRCPTSTRCWSA